jgi:hypothetical protein
LCLPINAPRRDGSGKNDRTLNDPVRGALDNISDHNISMATTTDLGLRRKAFDAPFVTTCHF